MEEFPRFFSLCPTNIKMGHVCCSCELSNPPSLLAWGLLISICLKIPKIRGSKSSVRPFFIFGDSVVDVGNNNHIYTFTKANFPPYGRDFVTHEPTGRFCNGKLAIDFIADMMGLSYPPPYLSGRASGANLFIGANFASASSGYYDATANLYRAIPLSRQLWYYREYQNRLVAVSGRSNAASIISRAIFLVSAGSSDFLQNYYVNPLLYMALTPDRFSDLLIQSYMRFIQRLYALGARRIGVTTLPPIGCLPAAITLFGMGSNVCVERLNNDAVAFNYKLNATSRWLQNNLHDLKLVVFDTYQPLYEIVTNPSKHGFFEARRACCGTGLLETSILCNPQSVGTCANASEYVFWDGFHPSEGANAFLASSLAPSGFSLITP